MRCSWAWCGLVALVLAGCHAASPTQSAQTTVFPPQTVMTHGDYGRFVTENLLALQQCRDTPDCAVALLNLGFVFMYHDSPYYDPAKALPYLNALLEKYPQTPWAYEGQVWMELLNAQFTLEQKNGVLDQEVLALKQEKQALEQTKLALEETQNRLQEDLRAQEALIRNLQALLKRSRDIDIKLEKKERELLR